MSLFVPPPGSHASVYFYEFQHQIASLKDVRPTHVKADHADEIPFVFASFFWGMKRESSLFILIKVPDDFL